MLAKMFELDPSELGNLLVFFSAVSAARLSLGSKTSKTKSCSFLLPSLF